MSEYYAGELPDGMRFQLVNSYGEYQIRLQKLFTRRFLPDRWRTVGIAWLNGIFSDSGEAAWRDAIWKAKQDAYGYYLGQCAAAKALDGFGERSF